jgi:hypothetical protein
MTHVMTPPNNVITVWLGAISNKHFFVDAVSPVEQNTFCAELAENNISIRVMSHVTLGPPTKPKISLNNFSKRSYSEYRTVVDRIG